MVAVVFGATAKVTGVPTVVAGVSAKVTRDQAIVARDTAVVACEQWNFSGDKIMGIRLEDIGLLGWPNNKPIS